MTDNRIAMTIEEAATYTGIGRNTMRQLVKWGKIPTLKIGRKLLVRRELLEQFVAQNEGHDLRDRASVRAVTRPVNEKRAAR